MIERAWRRREEVANEVSVPHAGNAWEKGPPLSAMYFALLPGSCRVRPVRIFFSSQVKDSRLLFGREGGYLTGGYFREEWGGHERGRSY